jgi:hypothetical protein
MENADYKRKLSGMNTDGSAENCPPVRPGGSPAHRNQQSVSRSLGSDPLVRSKVHQASKAQPRTPAPPAAVTPARTRRQHP